MALWMKRICNFNEWVKCKMTGQILSYGMYYWYDDENGYTYSADAYYDLKNRARQDTFDNMPTYTYARDQWDYANSLRQTERDYLQSVVLNKPIASREIN